MVQPQHVIDFPLGELSPNMLGRYDLEAHNKGAKKITNLWPQYPGGLTERAGSKHYLTTHGGRFIPWVISANLAYIIELVAGFLYIYKNDGTRVMDGGSPLSFATPWDSAAYKDVHYAVCGDSLYFFSEHAMIQVLTFLATDSFEFGALSYMSLEDDMPFEGAGDYPATGGFHDGRLYCGGDRNNPEDLLASYAGNKAKYTFNGTINSGSNVITNVSAVAIAQLRVGEPLQASEFPNSVITAIGDYEITISNNATSSNPDAEITRPKIVGFHDFVWYETIVSVSKQQRDPMRSFEADLTNGSATLSNIPRAEIYDKDTDSGMKVGDRVSGPGILDKDAISFVGTTTIGSNSITHVSSSVLIKLAIGEDITGQNIPASTITALGTNSLTISNNATATSDTGTFERDEIRTYIESIGETGLTLTRAAVETASDRTLFTGWHDPEIPEYETVRLTSEVVLSATAFKKRLAGNESSKILWMCSGQHLVIGTLGGERIVPAGTTSASFTCQKQTAFGSAPIQPVILGDTLFFVSADRKNIREYYYMESSQAYHSPNLNILADHILEDGVEQLDYAQSPFPIISARTGAGEIIGCAYERTYGFTAWFRTNMKNASIESFCVVPNTDGVDTLFCNVKRGEEHYLEAISPPGYGDPHLDAYTSALVAGGQVSGLTHLFGAAKLQYNGREYDITVVDGIAAVDPSIPSGASVVVGYEIPFELELMPAQAQTYQGFPAALRTKNIAGAIFRLSNTCPFYVSAGGAEYLVPATGAEIEDIRSPIVGNWQTMPSLKLRNHGSLGFTLRAVEVLVDSGG